MVSASQYLTWPISGTSVGKFPSLPCLHAHSVVGFPIRKKISPSRACQACPRMACTAVRDMSSQFLPHTKLKWDSDPSSFRAPPCIHAQIFSGFPRFLDLSRSFTEGVFLPLRLSPFPPSSAWFWSHLHCFCTSVTSLTSVKLVLICIRTSPHDSSPPSHLDDVLFLTHLTYYCYLRW